MNKNEHNGTIPAPLSPRQLRAITAILEAPSMDAASKNAGVGRTTLYAWLGDPAFNAELVRRRAEVFADALDRLKGLSGQAVDALSELINSTDDPRTRLGAVRVALDTAFTAHEKQEFEERLAALERLAGK